MNKTLWQVVCLARLRGCCGTPQRSSSCRFFFFFYQTCAQLHQQTTLHSYNAASPAVAVPRRYADVPRERRCWQARNCSARSLLQKWLFRRAQIPAPLPCLSACDAYSFLTSPSCSRTTRSKHQMHSIKVCQNGCLNAERLKHVEHIMLEPMQGKNG